MPMFEGGCFGCTDVITGVSDNKEKEVASNNEEDQRQ